MKFRVIHHLGMQEHPFDGTKEFSEQDATTNDFIDRVGDVVSDFEEKECMCIDQGGDDDWYELEIADYDPNTNLDEKCRELLAKLEELV